MPVIRKASSSSRASVKKSTTKPNIQSVRQPSLIREMNDTSFGTLDSTKDGLLVSFDNTTNKFVLVSSDDILSTSVDDLDLPDNFVDRLEEELEIPVEELNGGEF